ncbi:MAG: hypothetical protein HZA19_06385, partial [Nitrospirae bacterium]|nr:hypothetical protein [Nitrospirota bacterium]
MSGLWGSSKTLFLSLLLAQYQKKLIVICPTAEAAEERFEDFQFYTHWYPAGVQVRLFPSWETLPYDSFSPHSGLIHQRMETLHTLLHEPSCIAVTSVPAVIQRLIPKKEFLQATLPVR